MSDRKRGEGKRGEEAGEQLKTRGCRGEGQEKENEKQEVNRATGTENGIKRRKC